jgi:hypothetical protein
MRKMFISICAIFLTVLLFLVITPSVNSTSTAEMSKMRYQFQGGQFYGSIDWSSDDIHPGDEVTYLIALSTFSYAKISKLEVRITYPHIKQIDGKYYRVWDTIYYNTVLTNYALPLIPEVWSRNITILVPNDADAEERLEITLDIYYLPYEGAQEERFVYWARAPLIRYSTYDELNKEIMDLRTEYYELSYEYSILNSTYSAYKATHSHSNSEYDSLNTTYNQYLQTHSYPDTAYNNLQSTCDNLNRELSLYKTSIYITIIIAVIFIASTIYFAKKKPKTG